MATDDPTARVRARLLEDHRPLVEGILDAADSVSSEWGSTETSDRDAVTGPLERELHRRELAERFPAVIEDCAVAAGFELPAPPVASPPYVVVTSTGPVLRATGPAGRLVIAVRAFEVVRDPVRYRRRAAEPEAALDVSLVSHRR